MSDSLAMRARWQVTLHSLVLGFGGEHAVANHRAYAERMGYRHRVHRIDAVGRSDAALLVHKYSLMHGLLRGTDAREIVVFCDDTVAFSQPLPAEEILGTEDLWLCEDGHYRGRGNGGIIMVRGGERARRWVRILLGACERLTPNAIGLSRWEHRELAGHHTVVHETTYDGCFGLLLFPAYGHAMPGVRAWAVAFNPHILAHAQDHHSNMVVVRHLTRCLNDGGAPFAPGQDAPLALADGGARGFGRVLLLLLVLPEQQSHAAFAVENLRAYATRRGYAFHAECAEPGPPSGHGLSARLLALAARQIGLSDFAFCVTADTLVHDLDAHIPPLFVDKTLVVARARAGADDGIIGVRSDELGCQLMALADDRGREAEFAVTFAEVVAGRSARRVECTTLAAHPEFRDDTTMLVRYRDLPTNVRDLVMREDAAEIAERFRDPPPRSPANTALSFFRRSSINKTLSLLLLVMLLLTFAQQFR